MGFTQKLLSVALILSLSCNCGGKPDGPHPYSSNKLEAAAYPYPAASFYPNDHISSTSIQTLHLPKKILNQPLLWSPMVLLNSTTPLFYFVQSKRVIFRQSNHTLKLYEVLTNTPHTTYTNETLLQTFPILNEDFQELLVDFKGFRLASLQPAMMSAANDGFDADIPLLVGHVEQAIWEKEDLVVEQHARIALPLGSSAFAPENLFTATPETLTVGIHILSRLTAVRQSDLTESLQQQDKWAKLGDYQRRFFNVQTENSHFHHAGQQHPQYWDLSQGPIRYIIGDSAPEDIRQAIVEGIEYWNRAANQPLVQVAMQHQPQWLPPAEHEVMIDWIPNSIPAFSYAAVQLEPYSGRMLHGRIYLQGLSPEEQQLNHPFSTVHAVTLPHACSQTYSAAEFWRPAPPKQMLPWHPVFDESNTTLFTDIIRVIVAHEVGHTLGMRHNFAASLDSELGQPQDLSVARHNYHKNISNLVHSPMDPPMIAASVMDYLTPDDAPLLGARIRNHVLPYDQETIQILYPSSETAPEIYKTSTYAFCTDEDTQGSWLDCGRHDSGRDPLAQALYQLPQQQQELREQFSLLFAQACLTRSNSSLQSLTTDNLQSKDDQQITPWVTDIGQFLYRHSIDLPQSLLESYETLITGLRHNTRKIASRAQYGEIIGPHNTAAIHQAMQEDKKKLLAETQGLTGLLATLVPIDSYGDIAAGWLVQPLLANLRKNLIVNSFRDYGFGHQHVENLTCLLSEYNTCAIKTTLIAIAAQLEEQLLRDLLLLLSGADYRLLTFVEHYHFTHSLTDIDLGQVATYLAQPHQFFPNILMTEDLNTLAEVLNRIILNDNAEHRLDTRLAALRLLRPGLLPWPNPVLAKITTALAAASAYPNSQDQAILNAGAKLLQQANLPLNKDLTAFDQLLLTYAFD